MILELLNFHMINVILVTSYVAIVTGIKIKHPYKDKG